MRPRYKKPGRFNLLSIVVLLALVAAGYLGYCYFPILMMNAEVKNVIADHLTPLYRANLRPEPNASQQVADVVKSINDGLQKAGLQPKQYEVIIKRDKQVVAIDVRYNMTLELVGIDHRKVIEMQPHVETSAAPVNW